MICLAVWSCSDSTKTKVSHSLPKVEDRIEGPISTPNNTNTRFVPDNSNSVDTRPSSDSSNNTNTPIFLQDNSNSIDTPPSSDSSNNTHAPILPDDSNSQLDTPQKITVKFYRTKTDAISRSGNNIFKTQKISRNEKIDEPKVITNEEAGFFISALHDSYADQEVHIIAWMNVEDGKEWDFNQEISKDLRLYAKWLPKIEITSADAQKYPTNPIPPSNFDLGLVDHLTAENAKYKAYFDGWFPNADGSGKRWNFNRKSNRNLTLYGKWNRTDLQPTGDPKFKRRIMKNGKPFYQYYYDPRSLSGMLFDEKGLLKKDENGKKTDPRRIDTSKMRSMRLLFYGSHDGPRKFNDDIGGWDVSKVNNMERMFKAAGLFNKPIGGWNVSKVNNMKQMFAKAQSFNQPIGNWNVSQVRDMSYMFYGFENNSTLIEMRFTQSIADWDIRSVSCMSNMFNGITQKYFYSKNGRNKRIRDLSNWKPSCKLSKKNAKDMFGPDAVKGNFGYSNRPPFWEEFFSKESDPPNNTLDETTLADLSSPNCIP